MNYRLLSTKKLPKNLKKRLTEAGIKLMEKDFIQTQSISFELLSVNDYLIFTSKKAVKSVLDSRFKNMVAKPCLCVGSKTRHFLEKKGFTVIESADNAEELKQIIHSKYTGKSFTFFCGNLRKNTIPNYFEQHKIEFQEVIVYHTEGINQKITNPFDRVLFFSPSGVISFLKDNSVTNKICFCIGNTTAKALENNPVVLAPKKILIATHPTVEHVIKLAISHRP